MKEVSKQPLIKRTVYPSGSRYYCNKCYHYFGFKLDSEEEIPFIEWNYCCNCGLKIDWKKGK